MAQEFHRRKLRLEDTTAHEVVVYRVYDGDELLFERRGTEDEIARVRARCEPLRAGWRATLGTGRNNDPEVATGEPNADDMSPQVRQSLAASREIHELSMKMVRDNLQVAEFARTVVCEATKAVRMAEEEAARKYQDTIRRMQDEQSRPLISGDDLRQALVAIPQILAKMKGGPHGGQ